MIRADEIKVKKEDWRRHQMCVIRQHCCMALTYWQRCTEEKDFLHLPLTEETLDAQVEKKDGLHFSVDGIFLCAALQH